jgi:hypothetical protein
MYRWAKGAERKDGIRFQPGLGIPLLLVFFLSIGGPALLGEIARMLLPTPSYYFEQNLTHITDGTIRNASVDSEPSKTDPIEWHHGIPEVKIPLVLNSRLEVKFQLIRSLAHAADENRLQTTDLGGISGHVKVGTPGDFPAYKTHLFIGTTAPRKDGAGLTAVCQWERNRKVSIDMDFHDWQFETELPDELVFSEYGVLEHVIATKDKESPETAEQLVLRAVVTEAYD